MNYQSIWKGDEYAWARNRPRGAFAYNGKKCTVRDKRKVRYVGNDRESSEVLIQIGDSDTRWVPAREIVDFWDNYESELEHHREQDRIRDEKYQAEIEQRRQERQRRALEAEERRQREAELLELAYQSYADKLRIPRSAVVILTEYNVTLDRAALDSRLGK